MVTVGVPDQEIENFGLRISIGVISILVNLRNQSSPARILLSNARNNSLAQLPTVFFRMMLDAKMKHVMHGDLSHTLCGVKHVIHLVGNQMGMNLHIGRWSERIYR